MPAELTVMVPIGMDRVVEMRKPTEGALVVLARSGRGIPKIENVDELSDKQRDQLISTLGTLGKVVDSMIVQESDKAWLDDAMIDGDVTAEEVIDAIRVCGEKFNGTTAPAKKAAPVRRRR